MNVHHLELFYYVARHSGISAACKRIPYGVQQPAVSIQLGRLEAELNAKLFERRPFKLTSAGQLVYDHIRPFFDGLPDLAEIVGKNFSGSLRVVGLGEVMRAYVPDILYGISQKERGLRISVQELDQAGCEASVLSGEADIAITVLQKSFPKGISGLSLIRLPIGFVVRKDILAEAGQLLRQLASGEHTLVCLPDHELITRNFRAGINLRRLKVKSVMSVTSQDIVSIYAKAGLGVGLAALSPSMSENASLAFVPLAGFQAVEVGAFWHGEIKPPARVLLDMLLQKAKNLSLP